jgi:hypothetical protein
VNELAPSVARAARALTASLFAVRLLLVNRHLELAAVQTFAPVQDAFFPQVLRHPAPLLIAAFLPLVTEAFVLFRPTRPRLRRQAVCETVAAAILLVHQATYYYATWVVIFWAGAFLLWLAWGAARSDDAVRATGPFLAQLIIAFVFFGGAAGKWTAGYWSGAPLYDLFFRDRPYFVYAALRARFDMTTLRLIATGFSRAIVVVETAMAFIVFLPARPAAIVTVLVACGLWLSSGDLFDVAWPIIGLAVAGWILAAPADVTRERS